MSTHDEVQRFHNDYRGLNEAQREAFRAALRLFVAGLRSGRVASLGVCKGQRR